MSEAKKWLTGIAQNTPTYQSLPTISVYQIRKRCRDAYELVSAYDHAKAMGFELVGNFTYAERKIYWRRHGLGNP